MDFPKFDGSIHPDGWIYDIQSYFKFKKIEFDERIYIAISLVDSIIKLPDGIDDFEKLRNALKKDVSFMVFKNTNKRKLKSLKYIPEKEGGDTSKFISIFRKLCYNAEINDIEEQKKYLYRLLPNNYFITRNEKIDSINDMNDLINGFEEIVMDNSNLIRSGSIVALKHVASGKYLSSIENLCYTTGSRAQLVFAGSSGFGPNSLWKIHFNDRLVTYANADINLQHVKSEMYLGINYYERRKSDYSTTHHDHPIYNYNKSPSTDHTEVGCKDPKNPNLKINQPESRVVYGPRYHYFDYNWKFNRKLGNSQRLKSNDVINLSILRVDDYQDEYLRSHDIQFTIGSDIFQEVFCHNERLGGNDEWCIELIEQA